MLNQPKSGVHTRSRVFVLYILLFLLGSPATATGSSATDRSAQAERAPSMTLDERIFALGPDVDRRLQSRFRAAGVSYPPRQVVLVGFKSERRLLMYAGPDEDGLRFVQEYYIQGASGSLGPKLRQGDRQVPEGIYRLDALNPNSRFHVSLRINYPNDYDRRMAARDQRTQLGGDIFLHGGVESIGCLAVDNRDIEELFVLAADTGLDNVRVIISPSDLRYADPDFRDGNYPAWTRNLYQEIRQALFELPSGR